MPVNQTTIAPLSYDQSPMGAFNQAYTAMANANLVNQLARIKRAQVPYAAGVEQAKIFANTAPGMAQLGQHPWLNGPNPINNMESYVENLMKHGGITGPSYAQYMADQANGGSGTSASPFPQGTLGSGGGGQVPQFDNGQSQPTNGMPTSNNAGPDINSSSAIANHIRTDMAGNAHKGVASQQAAQANALRTLLGMTPQLETGAAKYGGPLGFIQGMLGSNPGARNYATLKDTAESLAAQGGIPDSSLENSMFGASNVGGKNGSISKLVPFIQQQLKQKQQNSLDAASGQLLNSSNNQDYTQPQNTKTNSDNLNKQANIPAFNLSKPDMQAMGQFGLSNSQLKDFQGGKPVKINKGKYAGKQAKIVDGGIQIFQNY